MKTGVIGIIPARIGSTRFPKKMLADIHGKTLIERTYENALRCQLLEELWVATDDETIFHTIEKGGGKAYLSTRPHESGTDRIGELLSANPKWLEKRAILNIQGDEPCIESSVLDAVIKPFLDDPSTLMTTPITQLDDEDQIRSPNHVKVVIDTRGHALYFSRAPIPLNQQGTICSECPYYKHLGIYGFQPKFLKKLLTFPKTPLEKAEKLEQLRVLENGYPIQTVLVESQSIGIDTKEDLEKLKRWL